MTLVSRIPHSVCSSETRAPRSRANSANPNPTAARQASSTGRRETAPVSSGPEARAAPATATAMPAHTTGPGRSPPATPSRIGTTAPSAAIGETTPIVPDASAA